MSRARRLSPPQRPGLRVVRDRGVPRGVVRRLASRVSRVAPTRTTTTPLSLSNFRKIVVEEKKVALHHPLVAVGRWADGRRRVVPLGWAMTLTIRRVLGRRCPYEGRAGSPITPQLQQIPILLAPVAPSVRIHHPTGRVYPPPAPPASLANRTLLASQSSKRWGATPSFQLSALRARALLSNAKRDGTSGVKMTHLRGSPRSGGADRPEDTCVERLKSHTAGQRRASRVGVGLVRLETWKPACGRRCGLVVTRAGGAREGRRLRATGSQEAS